MSRQIVSSSDVKQMSQTSDKVNNSSLAADLKSLFKLPVLLANAVPVFTGFWLAVYFTERSFASNFGLFLLTVIGSTLVMAGALVLNNWYEYDIDRIMDRTKKRPTVTGNISMKAVFRIGTIASILGFLLLAFTTFEAVVYAFIGWITYVVFYTMMTKRKYTLNTVIGSISGAVTPLIGWAAIASASNIIPYIFALIIFIWQMPHTFAIAIRKFDDYKAANVAMLPVVYGMEITKRQMVVYITCLLPLPFFLLPLGTVFVSIATILNIGYLILAFTGMFSADTRKWADKMFIVSVNYLMIIFITAVIVTLPWFS